MKFIKIMIVMLVLVMSVGAACAADNATDDTISDDSQDILETTQEEIYAAGELNFTHLEKDINDSDYELSLQHNYKFDNETDNSEGIVINKDDFVINGNGHTIDASNQSSIFKIKACNVVIKNLTFINANPNADGSVLEIYAGKNLTTCNVTFENNSARRGIIDVSGVYVSIDDRFTDSTSSEFGVIMVNPNAGAKFVNAVMTSSRSLSWGFIYAHENAYVVVLNSTFANTTSNYSTAIMGTKRTLIENSRFINLHASVTAGAVAVKKYDECEITNCTFINVTSVKNGGAIFADAFSPNFSKQVLIVNSTFTDCHSEFGGAILLLASSLTVDGCNFTNNSAFYDGGAIYVSLAMTNIYGSRFVNNTAAYDGERGSFGGTLFCDWNDLKLMGCYIADSTAKSSGALYLYDANYDIEDNDFANNRYLNGTYADILTFFDEGMCIVDNNTYSAQNTCNRNNTNYETVLDATGMKLTIYDRPLNMIRIPSAFDLRDYGWVSPVKDQGMMGSCWAFATAAALESAMLRYLDIEMDLSENNMQDDSLQYFMYGVKGYREGGTGTVGGAYALSWFGVFNSEYDTYDQLGKISPIIATDNSIHFQDMIIVEPRNNLTDNDRLKEALLRYGALVVTYCAEQELPYCNMETGAQYLNESRPIDHAITLVGWNDYYSRYNFNITPPGDGAWIIKNSWGDDIGDNGYFYISYYDESFLMDLPAVGFIVQNAVEYNKNYQYDIGGEIKYLHCSTEYVNMFKALGDDLIAGVGTYFDNEGTDYIVEVYVNDVLRLNQSGVSPFEGFHTIQLDSFIPIKKGDDFAVKITSSSVPVMVNSRQHYPPGVSKYNVNGNWLDAFDGNMTCSIKVYTVCDDTKIIGNQATVVDYGKDKYFTVRVVTGNGHAVGAGERVTFKINGKPLTAITDDNGVAKVKVTAGPGSYVMTTAYNGKTYKNTVTVKINPKACKVTANKNIAVDYNGGKYFTVKVISADGKFVVPGVSVKFTINKRIVTATTDKNGIAKIKITDAPGKYAITTKLGGKTYKNTVTVKHVLKSKKIVKVKSTAKKLTLKATLKINGKAVKGKWIKFKFKGKTYKAKTNRKGIAKVTVKKNVIKKLKKGKKYTVRVTYLKDSVKITVRVK